MNSGRIYKILFSASSCGLWHVACGMWHANVVVSLIIDLLALCWHAVLLFINNYMYMYTYMYVFVWLSLEWWWRCGGCFLVILVLACSYCCCYYYNIKF